MWHTGRWVAMASLLCAATLVAKEMGGKPGGNAGGPGLSNSGPAAAGKPAMKPLKCPGCKETDLAKVKEGDIYECTKCGNFDADLKKIECEKCVQAAHGKAHCEGCDSNKCQKNDPAHRDCADCKVRWGAGRAYTCTTCADAAEKSKEGKGECSHCKIKFTKGRGTKAPEGARKGSSAGEDTK